MSTKQRARSLLRDFLIALVVILCLSYLYATADAKEEDRAVYHEREAIEAARKNARANRLARIATETRLQLAEAR